jgi:hypothetical protein
MPTIRGFVEALEIGRAGQASAFLLHGDGSRAGYTIADLDADPERFNERLSQLGLLRDAMDRAEPVELEFEGGGNTTGGAAGGGSIVRVRRLTRDALERPRQTARASGQVVGLAIGIESRPDAPEPSDWAVLALMVGGAVEKFTIQMQTPERGTADVMVEMAQAAQAGGGTLTLDYDTERRIVIAMEAGGGAGGLDGGDADAFDGFVEEIARLPGADLMLVTMTTAPAFVGDGNVVPLAPFTPAERNLLVLRGSPEYALFEAGLRDLLRMRVIASRIGRDDPKEDPNDPPKDDGPRVGAVRSNFTGAAGSIAAVADRDFALVRGAQLMAPLCSAARPVWIQVNRHALDVGPDAECLEGLPTSDLTPKTMRAMNLPYRAEWLGTGCFNHGVYRFQFDLAVAFAVFVDGEALCVHTDEKSGTEFAHACLEGEHSVQVILEGWTCQMEFGMDVYRIR